MENGVTLSNSQNISATLNTFFSGIVKKKKMVVPQYEDPTVDTSDISDLLLKVIVNKNHSRARLIKNTFKRFNTFSFDYVDESDIEK